MRRSVPYSSRSSNHLKCGLRTLRLVFQGNGCFCFYRQKSTIENNGSIHAPVNNNSAIRSSSQEYKLADKYVLLIPRLCRKYRNNIRPLKSEISLDCKNKHYNVSENKILFLSNEQNCITSFLCCHQCRMRSEEIDLTWVPNRSKNAHFLRFLLPIKNLLPM